MAGRFPVMWFLLEGVRQMATVVRSPYVAMVTDVVRVLGIDEETLALALSVNKRTIERWLEAGHRPQKEAEERLNALVEVKKHLDDTFDNPEAIHRWMQRDSRYLGGMSPRDALRAGRIDRVQGALIALDEGTFI